MMKQSMTMVAWAVITAVPSVVAAQTATTTTPPAVAATTAAPGTCDCPIGDPKGGLKNLGAFAPLGLLGAMAAAGGLPGVFAARTDDPIPQNVASNSATDPAARAATDAENAATERARNAASNPGNPSNTGLTGTDPSLNRGRVPDAVSPDSLRAGLRAPNTGTPLPSVFLLGTGLVAIGCVTVLRTRS